MVKNDQFILGEMINPGDPYSPESVAMASGDACFAGRLVEGRIMQAHAGYDANQPFNNLQVSIELVKIHLLTG